MKTLERHLGLWGAIAIALSAMLGSGIFVLPGLAAAKTGSSVWLAYVVAGLCVLPAALSKAELATAMPGSGGTYLYIDRAFGPLLGTIAGLGLWLSLLLKSSFALVGFGAYLLVFSDLPLKPTALVVLALITLLNVAGVKKVAKVQVLVVGVSLTSVLVLALGTAGSFDPARLQNMFSHGMGGFAAAVGFVYISYAGVTKVAAIAEEVKNPTRNLPLSILLSLGAATLVYGLVIIAMVGVLGLDQAEVDLVPVYSLGLALGGSPVGIAAAFVAILTLASMANAGLLASSRFPFAMSRDSLLPPVFKSVHPRFLTPVNCIVVTALTMAAAVSFLDIEKIVKLASAFMLMAFVGVNGCVIVFRESSVSWYRPPFRAPIYPWLQIAGIALGIVLLAMLGWVSLVAVVALGLPGAALYYAYGRKRADRGSVWKKLGPRQELLSLDLHRQDPEEATADVLVPVFGHERSPETLVDIATALAHGRSMEVLQLTEVPEQTLLGAMLEDDMAGESLRRRVKAMADEGGIKVDFRSKVSRDVLQTVADTTAKVECKWLVTEWPDRSGLSFTRFNPLGWLIHHLRCNVALFKNAGIREIRKILVHTEPGPDDALVCRTADAMARRAGALITFGCYVPDSAGTDERDRSVAYYEQLRGLCTVATETLVIRGPSETEAFRQVSSDFDLMVMGGSKDHGKFRRTLARERDKLADLAACSVLRLRTPREQIHEALEPKKLEDSGDVRRLLDLLDVDSVAANVSATNKDALFTYIARAFSQFTSLSAAEIETALWERERTQNTAIGDGLAIPHASLPKAERSRVAVFTLNEPIDYGAPDGVKADVFFVIAGPPSDRGTHLMVLSSVARLMLQTDLLGRLRAAETSSQLLDALKVLSAEPEGQSAGD